MLNSIFVKYGAADSKWTFLYNQSEYAKAGVCLENWKTLRRYVAWEAISPDAKTCGFNCFDFLFFTTPGVAVVIEDVWEQLGLRKEPGQFHGIVRADLANLVAGGQEYFMTQETARQLLRQNEYGGRNGGGHITLGDRVLECHRLDDGSPTTFGDRWALARAGEAPVG